MWSAIIGGRERGGEGRRWSAWVKKTAAGVAGFVKGRVSINVVFTAGRPGSLVVYFGPLWA